MDITLCRATPKTLGVCDFCDTVDTYPPPSSMLALTSVNTDLQVNICPLHEGMLIALLLKNYVRRIKRHSLVGYIGGIPTPENVPKEALIDLGDDDED